MDRDKRLNAKRYDELELLDMIVNTRSDVCKRMGIANDVVHRRYRKSSPMVPIGRNRAIVRDFLEQYKIEFDEKYAEVFPDA